MSLRQRFLIDLPASWNNATPARRATFLAVGCALLYVLVNWRDYSNDFIPLALVPVTVLREGTVALDSYRDFHDQMLPGQRYTFIDAAGHLYPMKPFFVSFLALPFYLPPVLMGVPTEDVRFWVAWGRIVAALMTAFSVALTYRTLSRWTSDGAACILAILLGLGTSYWTVAGQSLNYHTGAILVVALLVHEIKDFSIQPGHALWIGFLAGLCIGMRPTTVVLLLPLGLYLCLPGRFANRRAFLAALAGAITIPLLNAAMNQMFFHNWMQTGYSAKETNRWDEPLARGFVGILFAPNSGIMTQSPFLLLALLGIVVIWRSRETPEAGLIRAYSICFLAYVCLFAKWYDWQGGLTPASRMLSEGYPILMPLAAVGWNRLRSPILLAIAGVWSVGYQILAIATFDRICTIEPQHRPWDLRDNFYWIFVERFGWPELLKAVAVTGGLVLLLLGILAWIAPVFLARSTSTSESDMSATARL